jgi:hypothetical protein
MAQVLCNPGGAPGAFDTCYVALPRCGLRWDRMEVGHSCALQLKFSELGSPPNA